MAHYEVGTRMGNVGRENNFNASNNLLYMHFLDTMSSLTSDIIVFFPFTSFLFLFPLKVFPPPALMDVVHA